MDLKRILTVIVDFTNSLAEATAETLPLTTPPPSPLHSIVIEDSNPYRPNFYSAHGAKAPYLYYH
jgi:hypothetical protein